MMSIRRSLFLTLWNINGKLASTMLLQNTQQMHRVDLVMKINKIKMGPYCCCKGQYLSQSLSVNITSTSHSSLYTVR